MTTTIVTATTTTAATAVYQMTVVTACCDVVIKCDHGDGSEANNVIIVLNVVSMILLLSLQCSMFGRC